MRTGPIHDGGDISLTAEQLAVTAEDLRVAFARAATVDWAALEVPAEAFGNRQVAQAWEEFYQRYRVVREELIDEGRQLCEHLRGTVSTTTDADGQAAGQFTGPDLHR